MRLKQFKNYLVINGYSNLTYYYRVREFFDKTQTKIITNDVINNFFLKYRNKLSEQTLNSYINALKSYAKFLNTEFKLPKSYKVPDRLPPYFRLEKLENEIMPLIPQIFNGREKQIRAFLYFCFFSGARREEILNLYRKNFDPYENTVKIFGKGKKERVIPLTNKILPTLEDYFISEPEINNAFNLTRGKIDNIFKLLKQYFPNIHPHSFRHSSAMHLQRIGCTTREIQQFLGHSNIITTTKYERADIRNLRNKINKNVSK